MIIIIISSFVTSWWMSDDRLRKWGENILRCSHGGAPTIQRVTKGSTILTETHFLMVILANNIRWLHHMAILRAQDESLSGLRAYVCVFWVDRCPGSVFIFIFILCSIGSQAQGRFYSSVIYISLGYLKERNSAAHYLDSDIFYAVIHPPARSKTYIKLYFLK